MSSSPTKPSLCRVASLQDGDWELKAVDDEVNRGKSKPSTWFLDFFSLGFLPSPRSQGRLLRIRADA